MLISVCVCTFRRPGVVDTLGSIVRQDLPLGVELEIVVVDNDCAASAAQAVQGFADGAPVPVRYAVEPVQNIATARNRAIDLARGEWIALVDDDECADPSWLVSLLAAALRYDAEIAVGPVVAIYPPATAPWLAGRRVPARSECARDPAQGAAATRSARIPQRPASRRASDSCGRAC